MKGLYFYKLSSPYEDDVTKDCKLTINEIDHNFVTLKNSDVKDISFDEESGLLTLKTNSDETFVAKIDLSHFTKDFNVEWDKEKKSLIFYYDGKEVIVDELVSTMVDNSVTNIVQEIISQTITDNTLIGVGVGKDPLGMNPLEIAGTYKAVHSVVDLLNGEELPNQEELKKGDRFLTHEKLNVYGKLYNFESVKKINDDLKNGWRVPSKEDWDGILNAVELCDDDRNHGSVECNVEVGKVAGKLLKSNEYWKQNETVEDGDSDSDEPKVNPSLSKGVDSYGFCVLPAGYAIDENNMLFMGEKATFWTSTQGEKTNNVFVKEFSYDKANLVQNAENPTLFCSLRLVKDYDGSNFVGFETINGVTYKTVLMPSTTAKFGYSIWLATNVDFVEEKYKPLKPNHGDVLMDSTAFYINEWTGFEWLKKEMNDGDSLVIKNGQDGDKNREYQLIDGKLVNIKYNLRVEFEDVVSGLTVLQEIQGSNLDEVKKELGQVNDTLSQNIYQNTNDIKTLESSLKASSDDLKNNIDAVDNKLMLNITDVNSSIKTVNDKLVENIDSVKKEVSGEVERVEKEYIEANETINKKVDDNKETLTNTINETMETLQSGINELEINLKDLLNNSSDELKNIIKELNDLLTTTNETLTKAIEENKSKLINSGETECANGVLTLKTNGDEQITIGLDSNYGTLD